MLPVNFKEANVIFKKPDGWSDEQCSDLHIFRGEDGDANKVLISKWQPSKEDIEAINNGDGIYLSICSVAMPPVSLFTENPFE